jgi:hypothetical protein
VGKKIYSDSDTAETYRWSLTDSDAAGMVTRYSNRVLRWPNLLFNDLFILDSSRSKPILCHKVVAVAAGSGFAGASMATTR